MDDKFEEVEIYNSINELEIGQVCSILEDNDIPYVRKDDGIGSYMGIYMGVSYQPKRIYVNKKDYEKALKLIPFSSEEESEINEVQEDAKEENIDDENQDQENSNNNTRKTINIIAKIIFYIIVLVIIGGFIMLL